MREHLEVTFLLLYFKRLKKKLDSIGSINQYKEYISFCDSYLEENLICQYLNKSSTTYTLQHGFYKYTGDKLTNDSEAYLNFISDYILLWGEATKNEFIKAGINEEKLKVVGMPKFIEMKDNKNSDSVNVCIYLNGDSGHKDNVELLDWLMPYFQEKNIQYRIKLHPTSKFKLSKSNTMFSGYSKGEDYNINIVHNSGVATELIIKGNLNFFYINDNSHELYKDLKNVFSNELELSLLFENKKTEENVKEFFITTNDKESMKENFLLSIYKNDKDNKDDI